MTIKEQLMSKTARILKSLAADLEPIVGRNIRSSGKKELIADDLTKALDEAGADDDALEALSRYGIKATHLEEMARNIETDDAPALPVEKKNMLVEAEVTPEELELRERQEAEARAERIEEGLRELLPAPDDHMVYYIEGSASILLAIGARRHDLIYNPTPNTLHRIKRRPHSRVTVADARELIKSGLGRFNKGLSVLD